MDHSSPLKKLLELELMHDILLHNIFLTLIIVIGIIIIIFIIITVIIFNIINIIDSQRILKFECTP